MRPLTRALNVALNGRGGGKPDSAMGGGSDLEKVDQALAQVKALVAAKV